MFFSPTDDRREYGGDEIVRLVEDEIGRRQASDA
jgi:hypothetical protein